MPGNDIARLEYARRSARYASDLTDREWEVIAPFMPDRRGLGRPRTIDLREVMNAILYMASTGCPWRYLSKDFPPVSTVQRYFYRWRDEGLWVSINGVLVMAARELEGREASPTAGVIRWPKGDSQSVKTTEAGGDCGYDAGKKIKGRKRRIVVDTIGLMVGLIVHGAGVQDRDGAPLVLASIRRRWPWLRHVFADGGYAGQKLRGALSRIGDRRIEIVRRSDVAKGFEVPPRRWVVERTFAWLGRCRRLAKDWERSIASSEAWATVAHIRMLTRRIATYCYAWRSFESGSKKRQYIPDEFKGQAADRVATRGVSIMEVAAELGVHGTRLRRWIRKFGKPWTGPATCPVTQTQGLYPADLAAENARLKRELQKAQTKRDILKKRRILKKLVLIFGGGLPMTLGFVPSRRLLRNRLPGDG